MRFLVNAHHIAQSFEAIRACKIHPHLNGYLAIKWTALAVGKEQELQPKFTEYFETFLKVPDFSEGKPFLMPFRRDKGARADFNRNVAGSYAPSSLRATLGKVILIEGEKRDAKYSLRPEHVALALEHLCYGERIPALSLAALLLRDYAIEADEASGDALVEAFRREFGFEKKADFDTLFAYDFTEAADWEFETL